MSLPERPQAIADLCQELYGKPLSAISPEERDDIERVLEMIDTAAVVAEAMDLLRTHPGIAVIKALTPPATQIEPPTITGWYQAVRRVLGKGMEVVHFTNGDMDGPLVWRAGSGRPEGMHLWDFYGRVWLSAPPAIPAAMQS